MTELRSEGFALKVQRLGSDTDRVLVLGQVSSARSGTRAFSTADVASLFSGLNLPLPANISARLGDLRKKKLVVKNKNGTWGLTPEGRVHALSVIGDVDADRVEAELLDAPGAVLGHVRHSVISPLFAPQRWSDGISRLLAEYPFEQNVFLMTRFPESEKDQDFLDPVKDLIPAIGTALSDHGLQLHLADDRQLDDDLLSNVAAFMWACQYGIGLFEDRAGRGVNTNVVIELGAMVMTGRRCAFLRDSVTAPEMPTDFVGQIYKAVDFDDVDAVTKEIHRWAALDLGLGPCGSCPKPGE